MPNDVDWTRDPQYQAVQLRQDGRINDQSQQDDHGSRIPIVIVHDPIGQHKGQQYFADKQAVGIGRPELVDDKRIEKQQRQLEWNEARVDSHASVHSYEKEVGNAEKERVSKKGRQFQPGVDTKDRDKRDGQEGKQDWFSEREMFIRNDRQGIKSVFDNAFGGRRVEKTVPDNRQVHIEDQNQ